jgi:hypothetical protein
MATYPLGRRPLVPFPYCNEVMTGFEYTAAVHMLYEGRLKNGLKAIAAVRARYDGKKRSPFNEAECGHHYARAMAVWAALNALTGFRYSGVEKSLEFGARPGTYFWSNGYAWGNCRIRKAGRKFRAELEVLYGQLALRSFRLSGAGAQVFTKVKTVRQGQTLQIQFS